MNKKHKAFTLTELLVVIAIIALLVGLAVPALQGARRMAREMAEKNNITNMELAIEQFKLDHGFYPESGTRTPHPTLLDGNMTQTGPPPKDQGAHRLFESLMGLDLLGYQDYHFYQRAPDGTPVDEYDNPTKRWGPYIDPSDIRPGVIGFHPDIPVADIAIAHKNSDLFGGNNNFNRVFLDQLDWAEPRAILYYRARKSGTLVYDPSYPEKSIYNYEDNYEITKDAIGGNRIHYQEFPNGSIQPFDEIEFRNYITDPKTVVPSSQFSDRPYNKDSFLLIGAGWDHRYGTEDDITNINK